jgi:hypothetical protein
MAVLVDDKPYTAALQRAQMPIPKTRKVTEFWPEKYQNFPL